MNDEDTNHDPLQLFGVMVIQEIIENVTDRRNARTFNHNKTKKEAYFRHIFRNNKYCLSNRRRNIEERRIIGHKRNGYPIQKIVSDDYRQPLPGRRH